MIRPYVAGDDVRRIDWAVTARTGEPHVRVDLAERVLVTWLVLDTSVSMQFGTAERRKADVAEGVAVAIGHLSTRRGNRLGVVTFGGEESRAIPPRQGRVGLVGLLAALRTEPPADGPGSSTLPSALRRTGALAKQRSLVVVVSDFRGDREWRRPLLQLAGHHDVVAVEVRDQREQELTNVGLPLPRRSRDRTPASRRHAQPSVARALRGRGGCRTRGGRAVVVVGRRAPRRPHDVRRLAASARHVPAEESRVRFDWPIALAALAALPILVAIYVDRDRQAGRVPGRVRQSRPDPECGRPQPGSAPLPASADAARRARLPHRRRCEAARDRQREARGGDDRPRDRRLALDEGERRRAEPARRGACGREDVPRPGPGQVPGRRRLVRDPRGRGRRADGRPFPRRVGARHAEARRGNRHRRRRRAVAPGRAAEGRERAGAAARRSSSSPTARRTAAGSSPTKQSPRRRSSGCPCTPFS